MVNDVNEVDFRTATAQISSHVYQKFSYSLEYEHGHLGLSWLYLFKIKVTTHVDSSPTNTERLRSIPVALRKIDSRELTI